ncbi:hypothetical protein D3C84_970150 [compost metagenome]
MTALLLLTLFRAGIVRQRLSLRLKSATRLLDACLPFFAYLLSQLLNQRCQRIAESGRTGPLYRELTVQLFQVAMNSGF